MILLDNFIRVFCLFIPCLLIIHYSIKSISIIVMSDIIRKKLYRRKRTKKVGLPPGTLVYTGEKPTVEPIIKVIDFNEKEIKENT